MIVGFNELYKQEIEEQKDRYEKIVTGFTEQFGDKERIAFFSAPGRTEIGGNHTDHNHGHVLAAGINLDIVAAARKTEDGKVYLKSMEYPKMDVIDLNDLEKNEEEEGKSFSLIKGICARCRQLGYKVEGFEAYTMTRVLKGSGLSSSAAFEVVIMTIISHLFNDGKISPVDAAIVSQYAENVYFGKPSGLMDQMASSVGSVISIDFNDPTKPDIKAIDFDLESYNYVMCILDTGGNHADLTDNYAAITQEMRGVAAHFGKTVLRDIDESQMRKEILALRTDVGDRAILRALHFFDDDRIAVEEAEALEQSDFTRFLFLINKSGISSETRLQNVFATVNPKEQGPSLALALSKEILRGQGACRVHGGGFAGTIQAFVPVEMLSEYKEQMEAVFGENSCYVLTFRNYGGVKVEI